MDNITANTGKYMLRLRFSKTGIAAYVSHLDVMRAFTRSLKRAGIPVWYTQGFTKRPYLDFPFPLPLGVVGENEILDIALSQMPENIEIMKEQINAFLPEGFLVNNVEAELGNAADILYAEYILRLPTDINSEKIKAFFNQEKIPAEKFSKKKGNVTIDLAPLINSYEIDEKSHELHVKLPTGMKLNINVNVLIAAIASFLQTKPEIICAKRTYFYPENGENVV
jgi:radical SAM-linked protein